MNPAAYGPPIETVLIAGERRMLTQSVRRVLPAAPRRQVGPFTFLDHLGPAQLAPGQGFDVGPHPHIGLCTVTYLFEGSGVHRDSLGSEQTIRPGELNWMTAGRGIVHSERSPDDLRARGGALHGLQLWVALPVEHEETEPHFEHVPAGAIATLDVGGVDVQLLAGTAYGERAVVRVYSPLFLARAELAAGQHLPFPDEHRERAVYIVQGEVGVGQARFSGGTLVAVQPGPCALAALGDAHVVLLGGQPFPEPRYLLWNFVSSSKERLKQAEADWRAGRFPRLPNDDGPPIAMP